MDGVKVSGKLRELRTEYDNGKPISHAKLAEKLQEKYHVKISEQTLKDYERAAINGTTENTTRGNAICGMRIEYLDMLADFYGVSADYILGRSDERSPDVSIQAVCRYTGLSETAVEKLKLLYDKRDTRAYSDLLSLILSDEGLEYLLGLLEGYFAEDNGITAARINQKDLAIFTASNTIRLMLERIAPEFIKRY